MKIARWSVGLLTLLALGGCAVAPDGPSVVAMPGQGKNFDAFRGDDASCRQYAEEQTGIPAGAAANQSLLGSAALGTVAGAAAGAAIGAATGNPAAGAAIGAASGLGLGTVAGAGAAQYSGYSVQQRYDISYSQCMTAKGNSVQQPVVAQTAYAYPAYPYPYPYAYYPYPYYGPAWYGPPVSVGFGFGFGGHRHRW
jgi:hypothetical protein